eukprot:m51a1_g392 hypothetical protein (365) ;mRNA; r:699507-700601
MTSWPASDCLTVRSCHNCEYVHEAHELLITRFSALPYWTGDGAVLPPRGHPGIQLAGCSWRYTLYGNPGTYLRLILRCLGHGPLLTFPESYQPSIGFRRVTVTLSSGGRVLHERSKEDVVLGGPQLEFSTGVGQPTDGAQDFWGAIVDDTLLLRTEVVVCVDPPYYSYTRPTAAPETTSSSLFAQGMAQLLASGQGSDAVIVAGQSQRRFPVHRAVVAAHSPVLRAALWGNGSGAVFAEQRAGEVRLEDVDEGLVGVLLEFLYTGASASDVPGAPVDLYMQLAVLADRLDVAMLRDLCAARVAQRISAERLADVLALADSCRMGSLRDACVQWVACHRHVLRVPGVLEALGSDACRELLVTSST